MTGGRPTADALAVALALARPPGPGRGPGPRRPTGSALDAPALVLLDAREQITTYRPMRGTNERKTLRHNAKHRAKRVARQAK